MLKLCECGCGAPTLPAKRTDKRTGSIKGVPTRFKYQHVFRRKKEQCANWKGGKSKSGNGRYDLIYLPGHPRANPRYVLAHILEAEKALGRKIPKCVEIHHHDDKQLVICQDYLYHRLLHIRTDAFRNSGNAKYRKCLICGKYDAIENMCKRNGRNVFYHRLCDNKRSRERYAKRHNETGEIIRKAP